MVEEGETDAVKLVEAMKKNIETEPLAKIDYIKAVDGLTMQQVTEPKESGTGSNGSVYWKNTSDR